MNQSDINALVEGNYDELYAVLAMLRHDKGLVVRALIPGAESVDVVVSNTGRRVATLKTIGYTVVID